MGKEISFFDSADLEFQTASKNKMQICMFSKNERVWYKSRFMH